MADRFDLRSLIPPSEGVKKAPKEITAEEQQQLLQDYELISRDLWVKLPRGAHIRYMTSDGRFRRGGFVLRHWQKDDQPFISLIQNIFQRPSDGANVSWSGDLSQISQIWKKMSFDKQVASHEPTSHEPTSHDARAVLYEIRATRNELSLLQKRVLQLEINQKKITRLLSTHLKR
jgi:hypothetical protein